MKKTILFTLFITTAFATDNYAGLLGKVDIHGFLSNGYLKSDKNNYFADTEDGTFQFNEMGLNFSTSPSPGLRIGLQFFARDLGDTGNDEITLDWAFADYTWKDWLGIYAGKMKIPCGLYNDTRDFDMLRTSILLPQAIYNELWRDSFRSMKGIGIHGDFELSLVGNIIYSLQYGIFTLEKDGGIAKSAEAIGFFYVKGADVHNSTVGNLQWLPPIKGLRLNVSAFLSKIDLQINIKDTDILTKYHMKHIDTFVYSIEYSIRKWVFASELWTNHTDVEVGNLKYKSPNQGYYAGGAYRCLSWMELGLYYSVYYVNKNDKKGKLASQNNLQPNWYELELERRLQPRHNFWLKDFCMSMKVDFNENFSGKIEGHVMDGAYGALPINNLPDPNDPDDVGTERDWFLFAAKLTFVF